MEWKPVIGIDPIPLKWVEVETTKPELDKFYENLFPILVSDGEGVWASRYKEFWFDGAFQWCLFCCPVDMYTDQWNEKKITHWIRVQDIPKP